MTDSPGSQRGVYEECKVARQTAPTVLRLNEPGLAPITFNANAYGTTATANAAPQTSPFWSLSFPNTVVQFNQYNGVGYGNSAATIFTTGGLDLGAYLGTGNISNVTGTVFLKVAINSNAFMLPLFRNPNFQN